MSIEISPEILPTMAADVIAKADFRTFWPVETRQTLVRAAKTEILPPYAVGAVKRAITVAERIERDLNRQVEEAESKKGRRF